MDNRHLPSPRKLAIAVEYRITFGIQTKTNIYRSIALSIHLSSIIPFDLTALFIADFVYLLYFDMEHN